MAIDDMRPTVGGDDDDTTWTSEGGGAVPVPLPPPPSGAEILSIVFALFAGLFALLGLVTSLLNLFERQRSPGTVYLVTRQDRTGKEAAKGSS